MPDTHTAELTSLQHRIDRLETTINTEGVDMSEVKDQVHKLRSNVEKYYDHQRRLVRQEWVVMKQAWDQVEEDTSVVEEPEEIKKQVIEAIEQTKEFLPSS